MKINSVKCGQFAGIKGKSIKCTDGLNVIIGDNESGKSTMVDLIYHLLFKDIKLDGRSDSEFIDKYFPKNIGERQADFIDGELSFHTQNGEYTIKKEWEKGQGVVKLTYPDGSMVKGSEAIIQVLSDELEYGAGVYGEIVFASQKRQQKAVETILRSGQKKKDTSLEETKLDLNATLTQAALESGGVSLNQLEDELEKMITSLDSNWDFEADSPVGGVKRGIKNPWKKNVGQILESYYEKESIKESFKKVKDIEDDIDKISRDLQGLRKDKSEKDEKLKKFLQSKDNIEKLKIYEQSLNENTSQHNKAITANKEWPLKSQNLKDANRLKNMRRDAEVRALYNNVSEAKKNFESEKLLLMGKTQILDADLENAELCNNTRTDLKSKIAGLNLIARINQLGDTAVEIRTVATGEKLTSENDELYITEAVEIIVPGILEIQLAPQGVEINEIKRDLTNTENELTRIFEVYKVEGIEALRKSAKEYDILSKKVESLDGEWKRILGNKNWEEIVKEYQGISDEIENIEQLEKDIVDLVGTISLDEYIGRCKEKIEEYEKDYHTIENLQVKISYLLENIVDAKSNIDSLDEVPEELKSIENPDEFERECSLDIENIEKEIAKKRDEYIDAIKALGETSSGEYEEELGEKEARFLAKKAEYKHWKNIQDVYSSMKETSMGNPTEKIEKAFRKYMNLISDGKLDVTAVDEKLNASLTSGSHLLTYDILSDGTKDTISLAFRLAMLEHLFPEGNALAVFDDPFTDMDPVRVEQACKLIQDFAENNQVIFITCDDKYKHLLNGNVISVSR